MSDAPRPSYQRLTVMLRSRDHFRHHSLDTEILSRARKAHLAGATLLEAVEGRGRSGVLHHQHLFRDDTPLCILVVDRADKLAAFLEECRELLDDAVVVIDDVTAFRA